MSYETIVSTIKLYTDEGRVNSIVDLIVNNNDSLFKGVHILDEVLQQLEIQEHCIAILCLLLNKIQTKGVNLDQTFAQLYEFISECDEQKMKSVSHLYANLFHHLTECLVKAKQYLRGIDLLTKAIPKIQNQPSQLTSIHADLCKLCILAKCLKPALTFLDVDISDISKENDSFDVKYYLLYFYYGGIIYSILRKFDRAFYFFQAAISITGSAVSEIMIEAYKKYILVSLLYYGELPQQRSAYLNRCVRPFVGVYQDLAFAYSRNDIDELQEIFNEHKGIFEKDRNIGLVKQVIASLVKVKIRNLTKTFMTLSLSDVASKVNLANEKEAEKMVLQMIDDGEIFANINQRDGMVIFLDKPEKYNTHQMYHTIEQELNKCIKLNENLKQLNMDILLNPKYHKNSRFLD